MPGNRGMIKRIIDRCTRCARLNTHKYALPRMPPLPEDRVQRRRPFESVGMDYLGPTTARLAGQTIKVWIVIITCLTVRAVYLEPTTDLSARSFIQVLRRFIARRGCPKKMLSDNAKTFVSTQKVLNKLTEPYVATNPLEFAALNGIQWTFIPQHSPWAGGIYERLVALVKKCVQRTLGRWILPYDELSSFVAEVEAAINMRPLTYFGNDVDSFLPLRPVDFIQPEAHFYLPMNGRTFDPDDLNLTAHEKLASFWVGTQEAVEHFWRRWRKEYLLMLREKAGWDHKHPRLQTLTLPNVGDVVLVEEPMQPRNIWPMGKIIALNGKVPAVRSVQLKMANGRIWTRPINKVYPLEASPEPALSPETLQEEPTLVDIPTIPDPGQIEPEEIPLINPPAPTPLAESPEQENPTQETSSDEEDDQMLNVEPLQASDPEWSPGRSGKIPVAPGEHHMITRRKGKLQKATLLIPLLFSLIQMGFACAPREKLQGGAETLPDCTECALHCSNRGVLVTIPTTINKFELCCMDSCWSAIPQSVNLDFELSREFLLNDYSCSGTFWQDSQNACWTETMCPAKEECDLLDCWFCLDQIANPICNPKWAAMLSAIFLLAFLSFLGFIWNTILRIKTGFWLVYSFLALLCCLPLWIYNRMTGRQVRLPPPSIVQEKITRGARRLRRGARRMRQEFQGGRVAQFRREFRRGTWQFFLSTFALLFLCSSISASSETISIVTKSESCHRGPNGVICTINSATTLTLLPFGQTNTLLLRDEHGVVLGALNLNLKSLAMNCMAKSEAWLRSYRIETLAVKRCPRAGSCRGNHCDQVQVDSMIPELAMANQYPGNTFCADSTSFWHNQCGLPASSCLYYRWHAKPLGREPFEMVSCPSWDLTIGAELTLETNGGQSRQNSLTLHPGITENWGNISITPLAISLPPAPILSSRFITNGQNVAIVDRLPEDLHCANEESAREFNCSLSIEACLSCSLDHELGSAVCHCRDLDLQGLMENPAARFPLTIARMHLRNNGPAIIAETGYSPVQVHLQMKDLEMITEFRDSKCWIENVNLTGCYKCNTGAQLSFECKTDWGEALAGVSCEDGTLFTAHCSPNSTEQKVILPFDHAQIQTNCHVNCPAGETTFSLDSLLHYVPLKRQFGYKPRTSATLDKDLPDSQPWFDGGFDLWGLVRMFTDPKLILIFLLVMIIGLIIAFLIIKLSPMYRMYRLLAGGIIGLLLCPLTTAEHIPEFRSNSKSPPLIPWKPSDEWAEMLMWISLFIMFGTVFAFVLFLIRRSCCQSSNSRSAEVIRTRKPFPDNGHGHGYEGQCGHGRGCHGPDGHGYGAEGGQEHNDKHKGHAPSLAKFTRSYSLSSFPLCYTTSNFPLELINFQLLPIISRQMSRNSNNSAFGNAGFGDHPAGNRGQNRQNQPQIGHRSRNFSPNPAHNRQNANRFGQNPVHNPRNAPSNSRNQNRSRNFGPNPAHNRQNNRCSRNNQQNPVNQQNVGREPNQRPVARIQPIPQPGPQIVPRIPRNPGMNDWNQYIPNTDQLRLDNYIEYHFGPRWFQFPGVRARILQVLAYLPRIGYTLHCIFDWERRVNLTAGWSRGTTNTELIMPGITVGRYWMERGRIICRPNWPCLRFEGGERGTSQRSRRNQQRTGRAPWRAGETHIDFIPTEGMLLTRGTSQAIVPLNAVHIPVRPILGPDQPPRLSSPNSTPLGSRSNGSNLSSSSSTQTIVVDPVRSPSQSSSSTIPIGDNWGPIPSIVPEIEANVELNPMEIPPLVPLNSSSINSSHLSIPPDESSPPSPTLSIETIVDAFDRTTIGGPKTTIATIDRPSSPSTSARAQSIHPPASSTIPGGNIRPPSPSTSLVNTAFPSPTAIQVLTLVLFILVWGRTSAIHPLLADVPMKSSPFPTFPVDEQNSFENNHLHQIPFFHTPYYFSISNFSSNHSTFPNLTYSCQPLSGLPIMAPQASRYVCGSCGGKGHKKNSSACPNFVSRAKRTRTKYGHANTRKIESSDESSIDSSPEENPVKMPSAKIGLFNNLTQQDLDRELGDTHNPKGNLGLGMEEEREELDYEEEEKSAGVPLGPTFEPLSDDSAIIPPIPAQIGLCTSTVPWFPAFDPSENGQNINQSIPGSSQNSAFKPWSGVSSTIESSLAPSSSHSNQSPSLSLTQKRIDSFAARLEFFKNAKFPESPVLTHLRECERKEKEEEEQKRKLLRENPDQFYLEEADRNLVLAQAVLKSLEKALFYAPNDPDLQKRRDEAIAKRDIALGALTAAEARKNRSQKINPNFLRVVQNAMRNPEIPFALTNPFCRERKGGHHSRSRSRSRTHHRSSRKRGHSTSSSERESRHRRSPERDDRGRPIYPFGHFSPPRKHSRRDREPNSPEHSRNRARGPTTPPPRAIHSQIAPSNVPAKVENPANPVPERVLAFDLNTLTTSLGAIKSACSSLYQALQSFEQAIREALADEKKGMLAAPSVAKIVDEKDVKGKLG